MRRLRAPDKSGAGESSAVLMEERETEEVGGRSTKKNTATVSAASLLPCIGVKSCRCCRCSCCRCLLLLLAPGKDFPAGGTMRGREREFLYVAVIQWGGRADGYLEEKRTRPKNKTWVSPSKMAR